MLGPFLDAGGLAVALFVLDKVVCAVAGPLALSKAQFCSRMVPTSGPFAVQSTTGIAVDLLSLGTVMRFRVNGRSM